MTLNFHIRALILAWLRFKKAKEKFMSACLNSTVYMPTNQKLLTIVAHTIFMIDFYYSRTIRIILNLLSLLNWVHLIWIIKLKNCISLIYYIVLFWFEIGLANKKIQEESLRKVERGAKVLIALHNDTGCLLQMPRGNIELIHPRTLLISKLKSDIDE